MTHNLLKGKRGIIFGALNEESIAWKVAVKAAEEGIELVVGVQVIIVLQHTHRQALAKATGTDKEKELVRFFY